MTRYDAIVVGAGPAGSTAARVLAEDGARVLMLDRASFPRDKPCGGGVTLAAARAGGVDLSPVIERTITEARVTLRGAAPFTRASSEPLAYMTQRCGLDAYLAERAVTAGASFRDGVAVREIDLSDAGVSVRANGTSYTARALIGADGANGVVGRSTGLTPSGGPAVALEANYPAQGALAERWERAIGLDLGGTPGGYAWLFPKDDHLNIGVGGSRRIGPSLRERLSSFCGLLELDESKLFGLRGYHLPQRAKGSAVARGTALVAGDAAGLVDPLSGEGIHAAFVSGRLAARAVAALLSGEASDLSGYQRSVNREIVPETDLSWKLQAIFQRWPRPCVAVMRRSDRFWAGLCALVRGDVSYTDVRRRLGPARFCIDAAAAVAGRPQ